MVQLIASCSNVRAAVGCFWGNNNKNIPESDFRLQGFYFYFSILVDAVQWFFKLSDLI